jgi:hypothetical protein
VGKTHREEIRRYSSIHRCQRCVHLLRIPKRLISRTWLRIRARLIHNTGIHSWKIFLHVMRRKERV